MNIAVTGGIGSGKSEVSQVLCKMLGGMLVSADLVCRELLSQGRNGWCALKKIIPSDYFLPDGDIDRALLRKVIFSDETLRKNIDDVIHPMVRKELHRLCRMAENDSVPLVVEIPLLFEKGWQKDFDCTLLVYATEEICVERIMRRDLVSRTDAMKSIAAQMPLDEKIRLADYTVNNTSLFAETIEQIEHLVKTKNFEQKAQKDVKKT